MKRVFAFIGFSVALTLVILNLMAFRYVYLIISIAVVLFLASLLIKSTRQARVLPVVTGSIVFACLIFILVSTSAVMPSRELDGVTAETRFQITDIPKYNVNSDSYSYVIKTQSIDCNGAPQNIKVRLRTKSRLDADYYDVINGKLRFYSISDNAYDSYGDYGNGIYINATVDSIKNINNCASKPVNYYFLHLREHIFNRINSTLKSDTAGISIALLTGEKSYISQKTTDDFRICGLSHFFAVSGFHISVISLGVYLLLRLIGVNKYVNTVFSLTLMFIYSGIADFSSSSIRSCIMISVMLICRLLGRKSDTLNSLGLAVFLICFNPFAVTDAGAVMTVCAVLGIAVLYPPLSKIIKYKNNIAKKLDMTVLLSISVVLSLIPAMYIFFSDFSIGSIFLNIIVEPVIILLIISVIIFCIFTGFAPVVRFLSGLLLSIVGFVSENFSFVHCDLSGEVVGVAISSVFFFMGICILVKKNIPFKITAVFVSLVILITAVFSFYQQSVSGYVFINQSGMVIIYDKDSAVVVGMKSRYDLNTCDKIVKNRNTIYYNCNSLAQSTDASCELCDNISVMTDKDDITVIIYDKVFKINDDCVIIGENEFDRKYNSVTISFTENSQLAVRRDDSG